MAMMANAKHESMAMSQSMTMDYGDIVKPTIRIHMEISKNMSKPECPVKPNMHPLLPKMAGWKILYTRRFEWGNHLSIVMDDPLP